MSAKSEILSRVRVGTIGELRAALDATDYDYDVPVIIDPTDTDPIIEECWDISVGCYVRITAPREEVAS